MKILQISAPKKGWDPSSIQVQWKSAKLCNPADKPANIEIRMDTVHLRKTPKLSAGRDSEIAVF